MFSSDDNEDIFREGVRRRLLDLVTLRTLKEDVGGSCKISAYFYRTTRHHKQKALVFVLYLIFRTPLNVFIYRHIGRFCY